MALSLKKSPKTFVSIRYLGNMCLKYESVLGVPGRIVYVLEAVPNLNV